MRIIPPLSIRAFGLPQRRSASRFVAAALAIVLLSPASSGAQGTFAHPAPDLAAAVREEARLGVARLGVQAPRTIVVSPALNDWSRVRRLRNGTEVLLTLKDAPSARRYVLSVSDVEIMVLATTDPALPPAARLPLARIARNPDKFGSMTGGTPAFRVDDLRVGADGVFLGGRKIADVDDVYQRVARDRVVEIRQLSGQGWGSGAAWGLLAGGAIGVGNMLIKCGVHWGRETESCQNLEGAGLVIFPVFGLVIGGVGRAASGPAVIYRLPPPESTPIKIQASPPAATPAPRAAVEPGTLPADTSGNLPASAPSPASLSLTSWDALSSRLQSGDPISVKIDDGTVIKGKFSRSSPTSLRIVVGSMTREIPADRVEAIDTLTGGNRFFRGLAVGGAIGVPLSAFNCASPRPRDSQSNSCVWGVMTGAIVYGAIGALIGSTRRGSAPVPVYSAPKRTMNVAPTVGRRSMGAVVVARF